MEDSGISKPSGLNLKLVVGSFVILIIVITGAYFLYIKIRTPEPAPLTNQSQTEVVSQEDPYKDWGDVKSELGFSLKYPYKEIGAMWGDDEYFQVIFFFPPSLVTTDKAAAEKLSGDIDNIRLYGGLGVAVIKSDLGTADLETWAKAFLAKEDKSYSNKEIKVLSEEITPITFAGISGYKFIRSIEGSENQRSPRYTQNETFIHKGELTYRITHLSASSDTVFPRSGIVGKEYLNRVDSVSEEVLKTFLFDGSKITSITVPKPKPPQLSGEAALRRQKLLTALRTQPFYDENKTYPTPSDPCDPGSTSKGSEPEGSLDLAGGIYVGADDEVSSLHAYDENGRHTGLMPEIPGFGDGSFAPPEERAQSIDRIELGSIGYGLVMSDTINGRIELVGKSYGMVNLEFRGDGNGCTITEVLAPVTPYSVGTVPLTAQGDIGPISYDIDGDGTEDFILSLVHPLFPAKQAQLDAVLTDMQATK